MTQGVTVHIYMAAVDKETQVTWQVLSPLVLGMAGMSRNTCCHESNVSFVLEAATQTLPMIRKHGHGWITTHMTKHVPLPKQSTSVIVCGTDCSGETRLASHMLAHHEPESINPITIISLHRQSSSSHTGLNPIFQSNIQYSCCAQVFTESV